MSGSDTRALSRSLLDLCRMRKLTIATAEILHRRIGRRRAHRHSWLLRRN